MVMVDLLGITPVAFHILSEYEVALLRKESSLSYT